jgi:hypothetical protein
MAAYVWAFLLDNSMLPPVWVRIAMLIVTVPALVGGATIRAQARSTEAVTGGDRTNEGTP